MESKLPKADDLVEEIMKNIDSVEKVSKSKEQILDKNLFNKFDDTDRQNFINAMQEYADQQCIEKDDRIKELESSLVYLRSCYDLELLNKSQLNDKIKELKDKWYASKYELIDNEKKINDLKTIRRNLMTRNRILRTKVAELEKDNQWISVDDRLPEIGDNIWQERDLGERIKVDRIT